MESRRKAQRPLVAVSLAVVLCACQSASAGVPQATRACGDVTFPPLQSGSHLLGDTVPPVGFSSSPPTSGWHRSGATPIGVFEAALPETAQVSALEAGGVVVTYNDIPVADRQGLEALIAADYSDRVAMTPYPELAEGEVVFTSWGAMQRCDTTDTDALARYVEAYATAVETHQ